MIIFITIIGLSLAAGIPGACADEQVNSTEPGFDQSSIPESSIESFDINQSNITPDNGNITANMTNEMENTFLEAGGESGIEADEDESAKFTGVVYPSVDTDVTRSTPGGNPLIPKYALGGVNIDIAGHLMEGRGTDNNVSSEISFHDHTSANGYITTIIKDFHYMGGQNPTS
jgi:hypothetical protein